MVNFCLTIGIKSTETNAVDCHVCNSDLTSILPPSSWLIKSFGNNSIRGWIDGSMVKSVNKFSYQHPWRVAHTINNKHFSWLLERLSHSRLDSKAKPAGTFARSLCERPTSSLLERVSNPSGEADLILAVTEGRRLGCLGLRSCVPQNNSEKQ